MDHLKTIEQRKERWYATNIEPRVMPVKTINLEFMKDHVKAGSSCCHDKEESSKNVPRSHQYIPGIPASFLHHNEAKEYLTHQMHHYGFAVIRHVLNISECNHAITLSRDYLKAATSVEEFLQRNQKRGGNYSDPDTTKMRGNGMPGCFPIFHDKNASSVTPVYPKSVEGRIFPFYGAGHSTFQWYLRSRYSVQDVFATIHNVGRDELITSFDGMILWTEADKDRVDSNSFDDKGWFHIDQNPQQKPEFASFQGLVNLIPVTEGSGGNVLVMGSHKMFPHHYLQQPQKIESSAHDVGLFYRERLKEINGDDWLEIDPHDHALLQEESVVMCLLGAGDMIVWDSRLVHCSHPGRSSTKGGGKNENDLSMMNDGELQNQGLTRAAGLVNMIPRAKCTFNVHTERMQAVQNARTLTHWVDKVSGLGEEQVEEVKREQRRVECMRSLDACLDVGGYPRVNPRPRQVLMSLEDLTVEQRNLI